MTTSTPDQGYLAALIDGEPGPGGFEVAIDAIERDAELRARFERGLLIGQVLRGEPSHPAARLLSGRVSAALASEPVVMRPSVRRSAHSRRPLSSINRPAATLAIAASLVAVAILVGPDLISGGSLGSSPKTPLVAQGGGATPSPETPGMVQANPAQAPSLAAASTAPLVAGWSMEEPADTTALDALLVDHRERASASGLTGFIPYAAVVGPSGLR
ncbi:MAG: hypothetical protein C1943_13750 [Halochromatium sp.]|nr:hypothetical protein [Halochromatium sp.]